MDFHHLSVQNFKTFVGKHEFDFREHGPGLHFLSGDNQLQPDLGSNAAGKSTLLDAIVWCLYGKTMRGTKAGAVRSWGVSKKPCAGSLAFNHHGQQVLVERSWSPNSLRVTVDGDCDDWAQDDLEKFLGLSYSAFKHAVIIGQHEDVFFDLKPTDKMLLLSELLDLDHWLDKSKKAAEQAKYVSAELDSVSRNFARYEGKLDELAQHKTALIQRESVFEEERAAHIKELEEELAGIQSNEKELKEELKKVTEIRDQLNVDREEILEMRDGKKADYEAKKDQKTELAYQRKLIHHQMAEKKDRHAEFDSMEGQCPRCLQIVPQKHSQAVVQQLLSELQDLEEKESTLTEQLESLKEDMTEIADDLKEIEEEYNVINVHKRDIDYEVNTLARQCMQIEAKINSMADTIHAEKHRQNPYTDELRRNKRNTDDAKRELSRLKAEHADIEALFKSVEFWASGFKQVRLFLIEDAISQLEVEVNNSLVALGLTGWEIRFDVERETKTGGVTKGFHVFVRAPGAPDEVPWEAWSGGEAQRLRLAGAMGIANLITAATGVQPNFEAWDEPTTHLSPQGIEDLMQLLRDRSTGSDKQLWLIDHHTYDHGNFKSVVIVRKGENGSFIEPPITER